MSYLAGCGQFGRNLIPTPFAVLALITIAWIGGAFVAAFCAVSLPAECAVSLAAI